MTLEDIAQESGYSRGYLSKVEHSHKAPPVSTLLNISKALNVTVSEILGEVQEQPSFSLVRKGERQLMARGATMFGYSYETLAHKYPKKHMEPYILTIPNDVKESPLFEHKGEEMIMVLKGRMKFFHAENEYLVHEGDCIYFDSGIPHRGISVGGDELKILIVIYSPSA
ncbi:MAG: XRE family transcriptional regulator [Deltaproteobacteria bacterium]|nr:XRE family transcriptional regulator [Deltaproteobacteria bacterium]